ncbi:MAG: APC family permease [Chthoniobacterales bacterium]
MPNDLHRSLGLSQMLFVSVGAVIGSAWLFAPLFAAQAAGPAAIVSWVISAGAALLLALVFAELGAAFPVAGGLARFSYFSHGNLAGFLAGIACWLGYVAIAPIEVQAMVRYLSDAMPWLVADVATRTLSGYGIGVCAVLLLIMSAINLLGVQWLGESNRIITIWKIIVPVLIPVSLIAVSFHSTNFTNFGGMMPAGWSGVFTAVSTGGTLFAMLGFRAAIEMAGEAKNPQRDIPLALVGSVLITGAIYILIQIAFLGALPASSLAHGWSGLSSHVQTGPFVQLAAAAGLVWLVKLIFVDSIVSPGGCGLVFCAASARLSYAMARNRQLPEIFTMLNRRGVPAFAVGVNFLVGLCFFAPSQTWQSIVSFISSIQILSLAFGPPALMALRRSAPDVARPFRLPAHRLLCVIAFFAANTIVYWCGWQTNRVCFGLLAALSILFVIVKKLRAPQESLDLVGMLWLVPYGIGLAVISALGQFPGGSKLIPSGVDIALLAGLSVAILIASTFGPKAKLPDEIRSVSA